MVFPDMALVGRIVPVTVTAWWSLLTQTHLCSCTMEDLPPHITFASDLCVPPVSLCSGVNGDPHHSGRPSPLAG